MDEETSVGADDAATEATEPVDALRRPPKEMESRLLLRVRALPDEALADTWRGTLDVELIDGDPLTEEFVLPAPVIVFAVGWLSLFSMTPNSFVDSPVGDGFVDDDKPVAIVLVLRAPTVDEEVFKGGETAEERLDIRGIFVGVSFGWEEMVFIEEEGGSLSSLTGAPTLVLTEGEPAIVGSWFRVLRRDVSDCFCMELTV